MNKSFWHSLFRVNVYLIRLLTIRFQLMILKKLIVLNYNTLNCPLACFKVSVGIAAWKNSKNVNTVIVY